ncbi:hypothetical protein WMF38_57540 [Sorangium sp. So ce118]
MKEPDLFETPERIVETPRYRELTRLDAYLRGKQYDGRPDWFDGTNSKGEVVPLHERAPCVVYPLPAAAVGQAVRFAVGEGRFPGITVDDVEDEEAVAPGLTISEDEAETLTNLVTQIVLNACLKSGSRVLMRTGMSARTAPAIVSVRRGKFALEMPRPQDCVARFVDGDPSADVESMVWCYQFQKTLDENGAMVEKTHWFRQDITAEEFITYHDAPVGHSGSAKWVVKDRRKHGLGFCPVVWIRNMPEAHCSDVDGSAFYGEMLDEFDALNFSLSQRHRGIRYFGTPQAYETNVGEDEQPAEVGRRAKGQRGNEDPVQGGPFGVTPKKARKAAPDQIWSYKGDARVDILETTGVAFDVTSKHVLDIRARILEALNVVLLDPETAMKQDLAGVALERLFSPMLAMVDELREHWWEHGIAKIIGMMLRIIAVTGGKGLLIPGVRKAAPMLKRFTVQTEAGPLWVPPRLTPSWGDYFSPGPDDVTKGVDAAEKASTAGLITKKTASKYVAPYFGVDDPEAEAEEAEEEGLEAAAKVVEEAKEAMGQPGEDEGRGTDAADHGATTSEERAPQPAA